MNRVLPAALIVTAMSLLAACSSNPSRPDLQPVAQIDLSRYMGDWYVLAHIPAVIEKGAFNAIENYRLNDDGEIETTFTFRKGSFEGPAKKYTPTGFVLNKTTNSEWGMQFVWPIKAEYLITYVDPDYTQTIVARNKRDYVWIMARKPQISDAEYTALTEQVRAYGYDMTRLRKVPQRWP